MHAHFILVSLFALILNQLVLYVCCNQRTALLTMRQINLSMQ